MKNISLIVGKVTFAILKKRDKEQLTEMQAQANEDTDCGSREERMTPLRGPVQELLEND